MPRTFVFALAVAVTLLVIACVSFLLLWRTEPTPGYYGSEVYRGEFPWMIHLLIEDGAEQRTCGAVLVDLAWALTAAHCFSPLADPQNVLGYFDIVDLADATPLLSFDHIVIHPEFASPEEGGRLFKNDLALLHIDTASGADTEGKTIRMVAPEERSESAGPGAFAKIAGWGETEAGAPSHRLMEANMTIVDYATCNGPQGYSGQVDSSMVCAGAYSSKGESICRGDSGGPLMVRYSRTEIHRFGETPIEVETESGYMLAGIISWRHSDCFDTANFSVFTRVETDDHWVARTIAAHRPTG